MTVTKVVRLRARPGRGAELDAVLADAAAAADAEPGTRAWLAYADPEPAGRVIIEIFDNAAAVDAHDRSPAVATLIARFADLLAGDAAVERFDQPVPTQADQGEKP